MVGPSRFRLGRGPQRWCGPSRRANGLVTWGGGRCRAGSCRRPRPPAGPPGLAVAAGWLVEVVAGCPASHRWRGRGRRGSTRASTRRTVASDGGRQTRRSGSWHTRARQDRPGRVGGPLTIAAGIWRPPVPRRPAPSPAHAVGHAGGRGRRSRRGSRADYGTGWAPAQQAESAAGQPREWGCAGRHGGPEG